jgi:peptidoglycan/xylan/chitin deacetylase (PgdA/CDA1 family)
MAKAAADRLRNDGGRMMSIGVHPRVSGNPGRADALARFIAHAQQFDDGAFTRRVDIANAFTDQVPKSS